MQNRSGPSLLVTVQEACDLLRIGRTTFYALVNQGAIWSAPTEVVHQLG